MTIESVFSFHWNCIYIFINIARACNEQKNVFSTAFFRPVYIYISIFFFLIFLFILQERLVNKREKKSLDRLRWTEIAHFSLKNVSLYEH